MTMPRDIASIAASIKALMDLSLPIPGYSPTVESINPSPRYPELSTRTKTKGRRDASLRSRSNRRKARRS